MTDETLAVVTCWCGQAHPMVGDSHPAGRVSGLAHRDGRLVEILVCVTHAVHGPRSMGKHRGFKVRERTEE